MSSPPSTAHLPPIQVPKRPAFYQSRKISTTTPSALHPLRQTSFPVEDPIEAARTFSATSARSETGSIGAGSTKSVKFGRSPGGTGTGTGTGRGRGRPRKDRSKEGPGNKEGSIVSVGAASATAGDSLGKRKRGGTPVSGVAAEGEGDEDDMDDPGAAEGEMRGLGVVLSKDKEDEIDKMLYEILDPVQQERYEKFMRIKIRKDVTRKITNQTLSQSVPQSIVRDLSSSAKVFVGELLEVAKKVQAEQATTWKPPPPRAPNPAVDNDAYIPSNLKPHPEAPRRKINGKEVIINDKNPYKGPLLPDHIREALRRYRRGESGGTGFTGLSLGNMGVKGASTWRLGTGGAGSGGRRLFH